MEEREAPPHWPRAISGASDDASAAASAAAPVSAPSAQPTPTPVIGDAAAPTHVIEVPSGTVAEVLPATDAEVSTAMNNCITISVPRAIFTELTLSNLQKIVRAKEPLLTKALDLPSLPIIIDADTVSFPWCRDDEGVTVIAQLIERLCRFALGSKRVNERAHVVENERFAMRTWLIRMGCNGEDYKELRSYMMKKLTGDSAWRFGRPS